MMAAPVNLAPLDVVITAMRQKFGSEIRDASENGQPVLKHLASSHEGTFRMCGLVAPIFLGEVRREALSIVGVLCLCQALENRVHGLEPRTACHVRAGTQRAHGLVRPLGGVNVESKNRCCDHSGSW